MQRSATPHRLVRIAANIDAALVEQMDIERERKGRCSRAAIIRMALLDRYQHRQSQKEQAD